MKIEFSFFGESFFLFSSAFLLYPLAFKFNYIMVYIIVDNEWRPALNPFAKLTGKTIFLMVSLKVILFCWFTKSFCV